MRIVDIAVQLRPDPAPETERSAVLADPVFGATFTDHMVQATWRAGLGWHDAVVTAYGPIAVDPATSVLHYGQEIFEGMKAYRHPDGSVHTFRPELNAARFASSARRLALPELPAEDFLASLRALVTVDETWVPSGAETSLYLRPFMYATEKTLAVRPASEVRYSVIASPAGPYFPGGLRPLSIWLSVEQIRAAPGGTGAAKTGTNYAASLAAQAEAAANGCEQVLFLDAIERRWIEEGGAMNLFFVHADGHIVTPELSGSILPGVTRLSVLELASDLGYKTEERRVSLEEWREGVAAGDITEVFATGTAAVLTPIGRLVWPGGDQPIGAGAVGEVTAKLRTTLIDLQYGRTEDTRGWLTRLA